jgi:hypothetical protein
MSFKIPKDDHKYRWTNHVIRKMQYYGLTPSRVLRVMRAPERTEDGVADGTLAAMQTAGTKARPWEIWVMWRDIGTPAGPFQVGKKVVITAWRYPGVSPVRERVPIPSEIMAELESEGLLDS